ncbi:MAG: STAS domain-containing protein [Actinobacteria bacterium]|nr:STAS domain-containing protein [Actinomycetota bacterium]
MKITLTDGKLPIVSISGEIDHYNAYSVKEIVDKAISKDNDLIIDLSEVVYIDTAGVGLLFAIVKTLLGVGRQLGLVLPDENIKYIINIVGLTQINNMLVFNTLEEALRVMESSTV